LKTKDVSQNVFRVSVPVFAAYTLARLSRE
jgi:hypothetical protein